VLVGTVRESMNSAVKAQEEKRLGTHLPLGGKACFGYAEQVSLPTMANLCSRRVPQHRPKTHLQSKDFTVSDVHDWECGNNHHTPSQKTDSFLNTSATRWAQVKY